VVKRRLALALLGFVALWPLLHRAAVARFGLDPWKHAGFAMYAAPSLPVLVAMLAPQAGGLALLDEVALPSGARAALDRFRVERLALGALRRPDDVARAVFAARPDLTGLVVQVQHTRLDARSARMRRASESFVYSRADVM
jgi:hypothetical protein